LKCSLSFKTVSTSRNIIVFKIKISRPKNGHPSRARSLVPRAASCHAALSNDQRIIASAQRRQADHQHGALSEELDALSDDQRIASAQRRAKHVALAGQLDAVSYDQLMATGELQAKMRQDHDEAAAAQKRHHGALARLLEELSDEQHVENVGLAAAQRQDHGALAQQHMADAEWQANRHVALTEQIAELRGQIQHDHRGLAQMHMMADAKWQQQANRHHCALTEQLAKLSKGHVGQTQRLAEYVRFTDEARRSAHDFDAKAQKRHRAADAAQRQADHGAVTRLLDALAGEHDAASARHARALAELLSDEHHQKHHGAASTQQQHIAEALAKLSAAQQCAHVAQLEEGGHARAGRWRHDREFATVRGAQRDEEVARIVAGGKADAALVALGREMRGDHATDKVRAEALAHTFLSEMGRQRGNHDAVMQQLRVLLPLGKEEGEEDDRRSFDPETLSYGAPPPHAAAAVDAAAASPLPSPLTADALRRRKLNETTQQSRQKEAAAAATARWLHDQPLVPPSSLSSSDSSSYSTLFSDNNDPSATATTPPSARRRRAKEEEAP
jgi:hypothetical protein